ncbi:MAG: pyridoxamine 5'-phosphate oxidase [Opitutae bacterium]|nr:pyridoxamine 5'-phosphate oxidase [Opitutae bacterium]
MSDDLPVGPDPIARFAEWFGAATQGGVPEPTAMAVATAGADGAPNVRMLLLKGVDARGFVFYTNLASPKAAELTANPRAALCFYWNQIKRQVRVSGPVERVTDAEADAYFATRPRLSQIGAWASHQSQPMADRFELERNCAAVALRFGIGPVPRPPGWSGYRVVPESIEFWHEKPFRLHERVRFTRTRGGWTSQRIFP